jgi:hypothetical protein
VAAASTSHVCYACKRAAAASSASLYLLFVNATSLSVCACVFFLSAASWAESLPPDPLGLFRACVHLVSKRQGEGSGCLVVLTSAASAARLRASFASLPGPGGDDPPSVRGGPPTLGFPVGGMDAVGAVGLATAWSSRRPGWANADGSCLLQSDPIVRTAPRCCWWSGSLLLRVQVYSFSATTRLVSGPLVVHYQPHVRRCRCA